MKWFILILMAFTPPMPKENSLIVTTPDSQIIKFDSYGDCYMYIHDNVQELFKLAVITYPNSNGIECVYCRKESKE